MHIIGNVIKQALDLGNEFRIGNDNAHEQQVAQLKNILKKARKTAFGIYYNFDAILQADDLVAEYRARVPLHDYDDIYNRWWKQSLDNPDIVWPGVPAFFAITSGTTGKEPKRIPVTEEMIKSIRSVGVSMLKSVSNYDLPAGFFEKQILMLGSSTQLKKVGSRLEGDISGISASNIPGWFEIIYKPGHEISAIDNWDEKVERIAKEAPKWDIGAVSGIPSWTLAMFKKIMEVNNLDSIHDIWPGFQVYATGGVAYEPFKPSFEEVFGREVYVMDTYLASEGFFAYNARPGTFSMKLALEHGMHYEFIPFNEKGFDENGDILEDPLIMGINEVDADTDYALIATTCAGNYRYMIGDTVRFTDLDSYEIKITGRTKYFLNVVGEQLSEDKMNDAIKEVEEKHGLAVEEFTLASVKDQEEKYYNEWVLGLENGDAENTEPKDIADTIDSLLKEINKNYGVARTKALQGVKVYVVPTAKFHDWHAKNRQKGGQVKTQKLMKQDDFKEFKEFVLDGANGS